MRKLMRELLFRLLFEVSVLARGVGGGESRFGPSRFARNFRLPEREIVLI